MTEITKLTASDPETKSADIMAGNIEALKALFPEAVTEGKIDFEVLKQVLGGVVDERDEKYGLNWHGKRQARQLALTPSTGTLRPCPEESVDWATTQNLMIEGDNLEVLKLLQKSSAMAAAPLIGPVPRKASSSLLRVSGQPSSGWGISGVLSSPSFQKRKTWGNSSPLVPWIVASFTRSACSPSGTVMRCDIVSR